MDDVTASPEKIRCSCMFGIIDLLLGAFDWLKSFVDIDRTERGMDDFRKSEYMRMTSDDIRGMAETDLISAVMYRLEVKGNINKVKEIQELLSFRAEERVVFVLACYEQENNRGGLCGFLTSAHAYTTPLVPWAMRAVGAKEHIELFTDFIRDSGIDIAELSVFNLRGIKEKEAVKHRLELEKKYSFSKYNERYRSLEPIEKYIVAFIRENADRVLL